MRLKSDQLTEQLPDGGTKVTWFMPAALPGEAPHEIVIVTTAEGRVSVNGQSVKQIDAAINEKIRDLQS